MRWSCEPIQLPRAGEPRQREAAQRRWSCELGPWQPQEARTVAAAKIGNCGRAQTNVTVYKYTYIHTCVCVCNYLYIYIYIFVWHNGIICMYIYIYICMYIYASTCVYICLDILVSLMTSSKRTQNDMENTRDVSKEMWSRLMTDCPYLLMWFCWSASWGLATKKRTSQ